jgi:TRAP-type mannitol/chloroaromatic compound transport system permease small subunit
MRGLLNLSRFIDALNERCGQAFKWLVLATVLISAGNALVRKLLHTSSNAYLEIQWYLFGALVLLCAGYTMLRNGHVRIDVIAERLSPRYRAWLDIVGALLFVLPLCALVIYYSTPKFIEAWQTHETSSDAGGLVRWPIRLAIPLGFGLLALQALSEIIKHAAFLQGLIPFPRVRPEKSDEEKLAEDIAAASKRESERN